MFKAEGRHCEFSKYITAVKSIKRHWVLTSIVYGMLGIGVLVAPVSNSQARLCVDYLKPKKERAITEVLRPKFRMNYLNHLLQSNPNLKIRIGLGLDVEVFLEHRTVQMNAPKSWVVVKYMASEKAARQNSAILREYQAWKDKGFLSDIEVSQILNEGRTWNMFPFYEGKELERLIKWKKSGPIIPSDQGVRKIWQTYFDHLNKIKTTFEDAGYLVTGANQKGTFDFDFKSNLPSLTVLNTNSKPILQISPQNIWVTTEGKFIIIDGF